MFSKGLLLGSGMATDQVDRLGNCAVDTISQVHAGRAALLS